MKILNKIILIAFAVLLALPCFPQAADASGFAVVALKKKASSPKGLKGKRVAIHGDSTNFLAEFLSEADLSITDIRMISARNANGLGKDNSAPGALFRDRGLDAAVVSLPEAMILTNEDTVGDGKNGSVDGAIILKQGEKTGGDSAGAGAAGEMGAAGGESVSGAGAGGVSGGVGGIGVDGNIAGNLNLSGEDGALVVDANGNLSRTSKTVGSTFGGTKTGSGISGAEGTAGEYNIITEGREAKSSTTSGAEFNGIEGARSAGDRASSSGMGEGQRSGISSTGASSGMGASSGGADGSTSFLSRLKNKIFGDKAGTAADSRTGSAGTTTATTARQGAAEEDNVFTIDGGATGTQGVAGRDLNTAIKGTRTVSTQGTTANSGAGKASSGTSSWRSSAAADGRRSQSDRTDPTQGSTTRISNVEGVDLGGGNAYGGSNRGVTGSGISSAGSGFSGRVPGVSGSVTNLSSTGRGGSGSSGTAGGVSSSSNQYSTEQGVVTGSLGGKRGTSNSAGSAGSSQFGLAAGLQDLMGRDLPSPERVGATGGSSGTSRSSGGGSSSSGKGIGSGVGVSSGLGGGAAGASGGGSWQKKASNGIRSFFDSLGLGSGEFDKDTVRGGVDGADSRDPRVGDYGFGFDGAGRRADAGPRGNKRRPTVGRTPNAGSASRSDMPGRGGGRGRNTRGGRDPVVGDRNTQDASSEPPVRPDVQMVRLQNQADKLANLHNACIRARHRFYQFPPLFNAAYEFESLFQSGLNLGGLLPSLQASMNFVLQLDPMTCKLDTEKLKDGFDFDAFVPCRRCIKDCNKACKSRPMWCADRAVVSSREESGEDVSACGKRAPANCQKKCDQQCGLCWGNFKDQLKETKFFGNPLMVNAGYADEAVGQLQDEVVEMSLPWGVPLLEVNAIEDLEEVVQERVKYWRKKPDVLGIILSGGSFENMFTVNQPIFITSDIKQIERTVQSLQDNINGTIDRIAHEIMNFYVFQMTAQNPTSFLNGDMFGNWGGLAEALCGGGYRTTQGLKDQLAVRLKGEILPEFFEINYENLFKPLGCASGNAGAYKTSQATVEAEIKDQLTKFRDLSWFLGLAAAWMGGEEHNELRDHLVGNGVVAAILFASPIGKWTDGIGAGLKVLVGALAAIGPNGDPDAWKIALEGAAEVAGGIALQKWVVDQIDVDIMQVVSDVTSLSGIASLALDIVAGLVTNYAANIAAASTPYTSAISYAATFLQMVNKALAAVHNYLSSQIGPMRQTMIISKMFGNFVTLYYQYKAIMETLIKGLESRAIRTQFTAEGCHGSTSTSMPAMNQLYQELSTYYQWRNAQLISPPDTEMFPWDQFNEYIEDIDKIYTKIEGDPCAKSANYGLLDDVMALARDANGKPILDENNNSFSVSTGESKYLVEPPELPPYYVREWVSAEEAEAAEGM
ncbi:MAG: hypothetical protein ACTSXQ_03570 [Alphaproteobacteria bacterium]